MGSYALAARATDNAGAMTTSNTAMLSVTLPPTLPQFPIDRSSTNRFFVDYNFDHNFDHVPDLKRFFGALGDIGFAGRIDGAALTEFVVYHAGIWSVDTNRDGVPDYGAGFGAARGDNPLLANFDGVGVPDLVIYRKGIGASPPGTTASQTLSLALAALQEAFRCCSTGMATA